jgi:thioredoxin-like negative regulator of GroEL
MNENDLQERKVFLEAVETCFAASDHRAVLSLAKSRLEQIPGDLDARIATCRVWILQGRLDEARDMLQEMEEIIESLSNIYACMGDICVKKGMKESAQTFYRKFMCLNPEAPMSLEIAERLRGIEDLHETNAEGESPDAVHVPSDFQTVTLAELYIRQGHPEMAAGVLEEIVRKDPQQEKASQMLREVREMIHREASAKRNAPVIAELSRWLGNVDRLRLHGA